MEHRTQRQTQLSITDAKSQKGFVISYVAMSLVPLFLVCIAGFTKAGDLLRQVQVANSFCRLVELKYQNLLSYELTNLLRLNPQARYLQIQHATTQEALNEAISMENFTYAAILKIRLLDIERKQILLGLQQRQIFQNVERHNTQKQNQAERRVQAYLQHHVELILEPLRLAVEPAVEGEIAPVYRLKPLFQAKQRSRTIWKIDNLHLIGRCGATLIKENRRWKAVLSP